MRLSRLGLVLVLLSSTTGAFAQVPTAPAAQPAPADRRIPQPEAPPPAPPPPAQVVDPPPPNVEATPPVVEPTSPPVAEAPPTPTPAKSAEPEPPPPSSLPLDAAGTVASPPTAKPAEPPPWPRAHAPLTLEGRLGFLVRPDGSAGFDHQTNVGAELGFSLYLELKRQLAAGLEIERASLGRGTAIHGLDSVNIDYTVSSAMLGLRAYPKRTELLDVFVGLQIGVGFQGVSATGTASNGALLPATSYTCGATDAPAFQIGGGVGARLMLTPRWGLTARINGTGRRLTGDVVDGCAQGLGTATTVSAGLGIGYDFDLEP